MSNNRKVINLESYQLSFGYKYSLTEANSERIKKALFRHGDATQILQKVLQKLHGKNCNNCRFLHNLPARYPARYKAISGTLSGTRSGTHNNSNNTPVNIFYNTPV